MNSNILILLTACVSPFDDARQLTVKDNSIREIQYKESLSFFLEKTNYKILFVENSLRDFSSDYQQYIETGRLEYLTFKGEHYDPLLGKGQGEIMILKFAFSNSKFIKSANFIAKITGRLKVANINKLVIDFLKKNERKQNAIFLNKEIGAIYDPSQFFLASRDFYLSYFFKYSYLQNDSACFPFETLLSFCIYKYVCDGKLFLQSKYPVELIGICGGTGESYETPPYKEYYKAQMKSWLCKIGIFKLLFPRCLKKMVKTYNIKL